MLVLGRRVPVAPLALPTVLALLIAWPSRAADLDPGSGPWRQVASPSDYGWDPAALEQARQVADEGGSAAVMVVDHGLVVAAWGEVERRFKVASTRKSLVAAMMAPELASGALRLDATLGDLGVDDVGGLTGIERTARFGDLLSARSGVYHPAAKEVPGVDERRPARGSHLPGTFWWYNNWDFNLAGQLLACAAGKGLIALFDERLARPLAMEDWRPADGWEELEPSASRWAAWEFRLSTRDLARFGQLILQHGSWSGRTVVPAEWVETMTRTVVDRGAGSGYGRLWWISPGRSDERPAAEVDRILVEPHVATIGAGGQICIVFPRLDLVVVHRGDTDSGQGTPETNAFLLADRILAARRDGSRPTAETVVLSPVPFTRRPSPLPHEPLVVALDDSARQRLAGSYALPRGGALEVVLFEGRLFASIPGRNQIELLPESPSHFVSRSAPVVLDFALPASGGSATAAEIRLRGATMRALRQ
jgi:CubicO group peptidase (beta-lactamase class C family)